MNNKDKIKAALVKDHLMKSKKHKCPECGTKTMNHYRCDNCWSMLNSMLDTDTFINFNMGIKRRITTSNKSLDNDYITL